MSLLLSLEKKPKNKKKRLFYHFWTLLPIKMNQFIMFSSLPVLILTLYIGVYWTLSPIFATHSSPARHMSFNA